jgi:hypothetical protein
MAYGVPRLRATLLVSARDFALTLAALWVLIPALHSLHGPAHATGLPPTLAPDDGKGITYIQARSPDAGTLSYAWVARRPLGELNATQASAIPPYFLLSLVVALLMACNLAFLRHLRRAYAKPCTGKRLQ